MYFLKKINLTNCDIYYTHKKKKKKVVLKKCTPLISSKQYSLFANFIIPLILDKDKELEAFALGRLWTSSLLAIKTLVWWHNHVIFGEVNHVLWWIINICQHNFKFARKIPTLLTSITSNNMYQKNKITSNNILLIYSN